MFERLLKRLVLLVLRPFARATDTTPTAPVAGILVVRQHDQLGDMLCCVPLLRALREAFPVARIVLVARPLNAAIMFHHPYIDEVLVYDKSALMRSPRAILRFVHALRALKADVSVVPATVSCSLTSDLISLLSGARRRIGAASLHGVLNPAAALLTDAVPLEWPSDRIVHQTLRNLDVLRPLGVTTANLRLTIGFTAEEKEDARQFLAGISARHNVLIGMHPGAGKSENRWPAERFSEVADALARTYRAGIVVTIGPMDEAVGENIRRHLQSDVLFIRNTSIRIVAAVMEQLSLFITNDTGIMHVAGAVRTPTLALFGPTDPAQWAPVGEHKEYLAATDKQISSIQVSDVIDRAYMLLGRPR